MCGAIRATMQRNSAKILILLLLSAALATSAQNRTDASGSGSPEQNIRAPGGSQFQSLVLSKQFHDLGLDRLFFGRV
jgi:hypothetical protein